MDSINAAAFSFDWSYPLAFLWGLLVLAAFIGWGQMIGGWLLFNHGEQDIGWGSAAAVGLSAFLILSGPMLMLSIFSIGYLVLFLLVGLVLGARHVHLKAADCEVVPGFWKSGWKVSFVGVFLFILLAYAGAVAAHWYNPYDDFAAYFPLTKMLLDTGTMFDPFSFRLIGALGGQTALDALIVGFLPWKYFHLLDMGVAGLIVLGLTCGMVRGDSRKEQTARLLLILLVLMFSIPRTNTGSEFTGVALFMALFWSFDLLASHSLRGLRGAILVGGIVAANGTLRAHNIFVMIGLGAGFFAWRLWEDKEERREIFREALLTLLVVITLSAPWWEVAYRSSAVFLYPLVRGNHQPEFDLYSGHLSLSLLAKLQFTGGFFITTSYLLLFLPVCFLEPGRQRRRYLVLGGILFLISAGLVASLTFTLYLHLYRYLAPFGLAFGLYTAGLVARQLVVVPWSNASLLPLSRAKLAMFALGVILLLQVVDFLASSIRTTCQILLALNARNQLWNHVGVPVFTDQASRDYREAFDRIPSGAKTLIALDYPFLLDYRKHVIFNIDVAGAASPAPGFPYFQGAAPVKKYLLSQGIRYIAQVPFDRSTCLHSRSTQNLSLTGPIPAYRFFAKFEIDFFNNIDQLAKSNRTVYDSSTIRVIDLRAE